jgi:hypothetical protein
MIYCPNWFPQLHTNHFPRPNGKILSQKFQLPSIWIWFSTLIINLKNSARLIPLSKNHLPKDLKIAKITVLEQVCCSNSWYPSIPFMEWLASRLRLPKTKNKSFKRSSLNETVIRFRQINLYWEYRMMGFILLRKVRRDKFAKSIIPKSKNLKPFKKCLCFKLLKMS